MRLFLNKKSSETNRSILFLATTPFAVNSFLKSHIKSLSREYTVLLCVNTNSYPLDPEIYSLADVQHLDVARNISVLSDLKAFFRLTKLLLRHAPSVIHSITPKAGLIGMLAGWGTRTPLRFHTFTGQVWATRTGLLRSLLKWSDRCISYFATQVFCDSESQSRVLIAEGIVRANGISVLGPGSIAGVDLDRFHPDEDIRAAERILANTSRKTKVLLFVGRVVRDKGVHDLLIAYSKLSLDDGDCELWIVGPDDAGLAQTFKEMATDIVGRVRWVGPSSRPERYMMAADIIILPSYREGFGSVIIEAAACGVPAVAYRIDGVIDAIIDGRTGVLVPAGDIEALTEGIRSLLADEHRRTKLGRWAYERVIDEYSAQVVTAAWIQHYRDRLG